LQGEWRARRTIPFYATAPAPGGVLRDVPLSSDLARISLHQKRPMLACNPWGTDHDLGTKAH
jgi:hypothetical protein